MQKWGKCVALWKEEKAQPAAGGGDFITRPTNNFEKVANAFEIRVGTDYHHPQLHNNFDFFDTLLGRNCSKEQ